MNGFLKKWTRRDRIESVRYFFEETNEGYLKNGVTDHVRNFDARHPPGNWKILGMSMKEFSSKEAHHR